MDAFGVIETETIMRKAQLFSLYGLKIRKQVEIKLKIITKKSKVGLL